MAAPRRAPRPLSPVRHLWGGERSAAPPPSLPAGAEPPGPGEANPFSFREFVRSQSRSRSRSVARGGARPQVTAAGPGPHSPPLLRRRAPQPFFPAPAAGETPLEESEEESEAEAEWSGTYRPSAVEGAHSARAGSASPGPGPAGFFYGPAADWSALEEDSAPWQLEESGDRSPASDGGEGRYPPARPPGRELQEENARLRSEINELHFLSESQADKVRKLERKLEENKIKEQKEAQDLEAMVQHVEKNLQLMTKRAVKAENNVVKLKQDNALLQVQLKNYKTENEALKTGQSASLAVVKQNADIALQNLLRVITNSRSSIKQLVSGAESLQIVAELLKSIDRISEISDDGP